MIENTNTKQFYPGPILNNTLEITDFLFNDAEQIKITHSKFDETGILTNVELNYPTDYEVFKVLPSDINASEAALTASTGQVTLKNITVQAGEKLTIYRSSQIIQDRDYPRTGAFPAASHEGALDYLTMQNQEQKDEIDRALKVPVSTEDFSGNLPVPIPSRALKINNDGTGFEMSEFDPDLALVTTEEFKNQAQQAAIDALSSQTAAANSETVAIQQSQNATTQAANARASADNAAELNQQLTNNFNTYSSSLQGDFSTYTSNLIGTKEDGMVSLTNASNALRQTQITNCLLEVPQRIKLELNNGVLTLKAGSEVIVPNGFEADGVTPKFEYIEVSEDISRTGEGAGVSVIPLFVQTTDMKLGYSMQHFSGESDPKGLSAEIYKLWYDTKNNIVKVTSDGGNTWITNGYSLPIGVITISSQISAINQVFNGIGYIGSIIWVDKGVKGLIPNGRNEDGTLNNIVFTNSKPRLLNVTTSNFMFAINQDESLGSYYAPYVYEQDTPPNVTTYCFWLDTLSNQWKFHGPNETVWQDFTPLVLGTGKLVDHKITQLDTKLPFRAADYNEASGLGMPSNKFINLTLGATGAAYTAPANGWVYYDGRSNGNANSQASINVYDAKGTTLYSVANSIATNGHHMACFLPVRKNQTFKVYYQQVSEQIAFQFIYAQGEM